MEKDLKKIDQSIDEYRKRVKGVEDVRVGSEVFDKSTLLTLYRFANKGFIDTLLGVIKTGKEANVFRAVGRGGEDYAVKIHRVTTSDFRNMWRYIDGDRRFSRIKRTRRGIVYAWVEKEFKNLELALNAGVRVPRPVVSRNNVLIMEFVGDEKAADMLKNSRLEDPESVFLELREALKIMRMRGFVHGDFSEYNVLMDGDKPVIIDFSQGVLKHHPLFEELLVRDVSNLARFFNRFFDVDRAEVYKYVTGAL
ncbi:MAG: serine protein kinase RIO [Candidatus Hydrothermarchaeales archaeon]